MKNIAYIIVVNIMFTFTAFAGEIVIANSSEVDMSASDLKKIYLGQKRNWSDGNKVIVTTLKNNSINESFMKNRIGKKPNQFEMVWKKRVFTGQGVMPKSFPDEKSLIDYVANNKGAIGYVSDSIQKNIPSNITRLTIN